MIKLKKVSLFVMVNRWDKYALNECTNPVISEIKLTIRGFNIKLVVRGYLTLLKNND